MAAPLVLPGRPIYVLNVSVTTHDDASAVEAALRDPLLALRDEARQRLLALDPP